MERRAPNEPETVACYREFEPPPALRGSVRALFSFTSGAEPTPSRRVTLEMCCAAGDRCPSPMLADGNSSIVFTLGAVFRSDGTWRDDAAAVGGNVIGAMTRAAPVAADGGGELPAMVGAYLRPATLPRVVGVPSCELTDRIVRIEELWGRSAREVTERLLPRDETTRLDLLESTLLRRTAEPRERGSAVDVRRLAADILRSGGRVSIEALARAAGVSRQQLTRVFRERVGVSPKLYCRLARFQAALAHAPDGDAADWAGIAADVGYADQSHMIAEFREFSSLTPRMVATGRWLHPFIERARRLSPTLTVRRRPARS